MKSIYVDYNTWRGLYRVMQRANVNAMRVAVETGMRIDDVLSLQTESLYKGDKTQGNNKFTYRAKKTGKIGKAEISVDLWRELRANAGEIWVFPGRNPEKHRTRQAVYKDVKKGARLLGFEGQISPHSARKTFAVELRKTAGLVEVQKALQHSDKETTMLYAFADMANVGNAEQALNIDALADLIVERIEQLFVNRGIFSQKKP